MEVERLASKQLHKHAVPIVMIVTAILAVSVISVSGHLTPSQNQQAAARGLVTHVINIKSSPDGLAKVEINQQTPDQPQGSLGKSLIQAGRSAQADLVSR